MTILEAELTVIFLIFLIVFIAQCVLTGMTYSLGLEKNYRKFYATPVIAVTKSMRDDSNFKKWEVILFSIIYYIFVTSLILGIWFIGWLFYKFFILLNIYQKKES